MFSSRTLRSMRVIFFLMVASFIEYQGYLLSKIPVSGVIENIHESQGRHSSTLVFAVRFSYGVDNINANGYRGHHYKEGDTFTASCEYIPLIGCAGMAYTGYVDSFWGRHSLVLMVFKIFLLFFSLILTVELCRKSEKQRF